MSIATALIAHGDSAATYEHRCSRCAAIWVDNSPRETCCPFCGAGQVEDV